MPTEENKVDDSTHVTIEASRDVTVGGDIVGRDKVVSTVVHGDMVGRDKITVVDASILNWLAMGAANALSWIRLAGTAIILGLIVSVVGRQLFGAESITDSAAVSILHGALGAVIGGLIAWYSSSLPAALLRVAWIEGGLVIAEWIISRLLPVAPRSVPTWFGLPVLHATLLVSLIAGPWLALVTFVLIKVIRRESSSPATRLWWIEALAIIGGSLASGLLVMVIFGAYLNRVAPPVNPSLPPAMVQSRIPAWSSAIIPPECKLAPGAAYYSCPGPARYDSHQEGFIVLPGWLKLSQAVAILLSLAMIIPASVVLLAQAQGKSPALRRPIILVLLGCAVSAAIGIGLDLVAVNMYGGKPVAPELLSPRERMLYGPVAIALLWGTLGLASGLVTSALYTLAGRFWLNKTAKRDAV